MITLRRLALLVAVLVGPAGPGLATAQEDPFVGTFTSDVLTMTVLAPRTGSYAGRFAIAGEALPFTARAVQLGTPAMQGSYVQAGAQHDFEAILTGDAVLVSDGVSTFLLARTDRRLDPTEAEEILVAAGHGAPGPEPSTGAVSPPVRDEADGVPVASAPGVESAELGLRFRPPPGWTSTDQGGAWVLEASGIEGQIFVLPHDFTSLDQVRASAREGYADETTRLALDGEPTAFGRDGLQAEFTGQVSGRPVRALAVGLLSEHGGGVSLLAAAASAAFGSPQREAVEALAASVEFFPPRAPDVASTWKDKLQNARLTYLYGYYSGGVDGTYVGASEETVIDLCLGYFSYGSSSSLSADGGVGGGYNVSGSQSSNRRGSGTWDVVARGGQAVLQLSFHDGTVREWVVSTGEDGSGTYLDGDRFYRTYASSPVEDARPSCS